jgi:hypothetical protein
VYSIALFHEPFHYLDFGDSFSDIGELERMDCEKPW